MPNIQIGKDATIGTTESWLQQIAQTDAPTQIYLSRNRRARFFVEERIAAVIAAAARKTEVHVVDWIGRWDGDDAFEHFSSSFAALAAVAAGARITPNSSTSEVELSEDTRLRILDTVRRRGGRLEEAAERSLTICFDSESEPLLLSGLTAPKRAKAFAFEVEAMRRQHLELNSPRGVQPRARPDILRALHQPLYEAVWELYCNAVMYGAAGSAGRRLPGMRVLRLKRHVGSDSHLVERAQDFPPLEIYLRQTCTERFNKFYEFSILDVGMGLIDRYLAMRSQFRAIQDEGFERRDILHKLLFEGATESSMAGAGWGLHRALTTLSRLKAFSFLRTAEFFVTFPMVHGKPVAADVLPLGTVAHSPGTHFGMLIPLPASSEDEQ